MLYRGTFNIDEPRLGVRAVLVKQKMKDGMTFTVYVRVEGRITIPLEIRDALDIKRGDLVQCQIRKVR